MLILVEIASFALDTQRHTPVILLKEVAGERTLPVAIGPLEASMIAIESLDVVPEKPLSIDLVKLVIENMGGAVSRIVITELAENSLLAKLQITSANRMILLDCRPADAIALALRCRVDIFVEDKVLDRINAGTVSVKERIRNRIRSLDTIEFGKYFLE